MEQWPGADPAAARRRYDTDLRAARRAGRDVLRSDLPAAHGGAVVVLLAAVIVGILVGLTTGLLVVAAFAALFLTAYAVMCLPGVGNESPAWRRAYLLAFGWANWL